MNPIHIPHLRLASQQLIAANFTSPLELVTWMCAMQAQDFPMAEWALGARLPGSTNTIIEAAINKGDLLRTHLLRPTWHFVAPEDICWLLNLSAPQIKASQNARDRQLELTEEVYHRSNTILQRALEAHGQLPREDLVIELNKSGISTDQNRAAHLLMRAELDKIICSGALLRGKPTYALLAERVQKPRQLSREEALTELASRYFTSRGPATLQDFTWWSGLRAKDARLALELVRSQFVKEEIEGVDYWLSPGTVALQTDQPSVLLLPTYDEFILSYENRTASIPLDLENHMKEISNRGVFWPILVIDGRVVAIWKRTIIKDTILVEIMPFSEIKPRTVRVLEKAAMRFAEFWGKKLEFVTPFQTI